MAAGRFNHPHAIQIFDFDKSEGRHFYLAMEYVEGMDMGLFLRQKGRLPVAQAVKLMRQIVSCLTEAHRVCAAQRVARSTTLESPFVVG